MNEINSIPKSSFKFITLVLTQFLLLSLITIGFLGEANLATLFIIIPTIAYGMLRLAVLGQSQEPRWGIILLWLYGVYIALLPGLVQVTNESYFWSVQGDYSALTVFLASTMMCIGLIITDVTYCVSKKTIINDFRDKLKITSVNYVILSFFVILAALWSGYLISQFGFGFFLQTRGAVGSVLEAVYSKAELGLQMNLGTSLLMAMLIILLDLVTNPERQNKSAYLWFLFICILILNLIINSPLRMARYILFAMLLGIIFVLCKNKIIKFNIHYWLILLFAPALYFFFRFMGIFARGETTDFASALSSVSDLNQTLSHGDFDGIQMHILGLNHVMENGIHWGQQIIGSILFFIPRDIWAFKAMPSNMLIAETNGQAYTNLSASFFLEGYLDWGWIGVIFMSILLGKILILVDRKSLHGFQSIPALLFIAFIPITMRGALLAVIAPIAATLFWSWCITKFSLKAQQGVPGATSSKTPM